MSEILHLTLKKEYFDKIAMGIKKIEIRDATPYWKKRLSGKHFDEVYFTNGYGKDKPFMRVECKQIGSVSDFWGVSKFAIYLGDVLEIKNWNKKE